MEFDKINYVFGIEDSENIGIYNTNDKTIEVKEVSNLE